MNDVIDQLKQHEADRLLAGVEITIVDKTIQVLLSADMSLWTLDQFIKPYTEWCRRSIKGNGPIVYDIQLVVDSHIVFRHQLPVPSRLCDLLPVGQVYPSVPRIGAGTIMEQADPDEYIRTIAKTHRIDYDSFTLEDLSGLSKESILSLGRRLKSVLRPGQITWPDVPDYVRQLLRPPQRILTSFVTAEGAVSLSGLATQTREVNGHIGAFLVHHSLCINISIAGQLGTLWVELASLTGSWTYFSWTHGANRRLDICPELQRLIDNPARRLFV